MNLVQYMQKDPPLAHYYYLCGEVARGVELVVNDVVSKCKPAATEHVVFYADVDSVGDFIDGLYLISTLPRLVVLRNAQAFKRWDLIFKWAVHPVTTSLIVITDEADPRDGKSPEMFRWFAKYGIFVESRKLSQSAIITLAKAMLNASDSLAARIADLCGGDSDYLLGELLKFKLANIPARYVLNLLQPNEEIDIIRKLWSKPPLMPLYDSEELSQMFGLVEVELVREACVIGLKRAGLQAFEMANRLAVPNFALPEILNRALSSTPEQLASRLDLVTRAQDFFHRGARTGLLEWFMFYWKRV